MNARPAVVDPELDAEDGPPGRAPLVASPGDRDTSGPISCSASLPAIVRIRFPSPPVSREAMWVERGATLLTPLEALEESAFWRAVPVDRDAAAPMDTALEVDAPRDHH